MASLATRAGRGWTKPQALELFLDYLRRRRHRRPPHRPRHRDVRRRATSGTGACSSLNRSLDTMDLTLHLERDGAFAGRPPIRHFTLDALCEHVRRHPARSPHRRRRRVHHRAGLPAAGSPGREIRPRDARTHRRAIRGRDPLVSRLWLFIVPQRSSESPGRSGKIR